MASFTPNRIDLTAINNGKRYENGDFPTPETFNAPIEAAAFAQNIATNNESQISSLKSKVEKHSDQISRNTKQIENLESQISGDLIQVDTQIAYKTDVPLRSTPNAFIEMFGGMSYKTKNLFDESKVTLGKNYGGETGLAFRAVSAILPYKYPMYIKANGAFDIRYEINYLTENKYSYGAILANSGWLTTTDKYTTPYYEYAKYIVVLFDAVDVNRVLTRADIEAMQLQVSYNEIDAYEPYFEGLRHTKPTAFKSFGANVFDESKVTYGKNCGGDIGIPYRAVSAILPHKYPMYIKINNLPSNMRYEINYHSADEYSYDAFVAASGWIEDTEVHTTVNYANANYIIILIGTKDNVSEVTKADIEAMQLQVSYNDFNSYSPYREPISFAIPNIDEIEYGIDRYYYNFVDWRNKLRHKRVVRGIISNVFKPYNVYENIQYFAFAKPVDFIGYRDGSNAFEIVGFETREDSSDWDNSKHIGKATGSASWDDIWVGFPIGTTLEQAKVALEGKEWIYALAKEQVDNISHLLPNDNLVAVQRGGAMSVESNYNGYALPRTIVYQLRATNRD